MKNRWIGLDMDTLPGTRCAISRLPDSKSSSGLTYLPPALQRLLPRSSKSCLGFGAFLHELFRG
ncbi:hypothetical protein YQ44_14330 [Janthinobacterium sp. 1_2014MBL_MicDiv]|nr:hypothetical protein YQ44_14330 [Janthinobacterium sp. 1_2014MBL_MicDiv]